MKLWQKMFLYRYFPFVTFLICLLAELILPRVCFWHGKLIFVLWPVLLLMWLIYWVVRYPEKTKQSYYLFVVLIFLTFALAVISVLLVNFFDLPKSYTTYMGKIVIVVYFVLAIYQLWAKQHFDKKG